MNAKLLYAIINLDRNEVISASEDIEDAEEAADMGNEQTARATGRTVYCIESVSVVRDGGRLAKEGKG